MPLITDPKVDEILNKNTNISYVDTFFDQNQAIIRELFLQIRDRIIYKKITKRAVMQICEFFSIFFKANKHE